MDASKVLLVSTSSNANHGGGRTRILDMSRELRGQGFSPSILCFFYGAQARAGRRALAKARLQLELDSQCPVIYLPILPLTRLSWINGLNNWFCGFLIFLICFRYGIRIILGLGYKAGYLGLFARAVNRNLNIISDIQGVATHEYMYAHGLADPDCEALRMTAEEAHTLKNSDHLIFVSRAMQTYYQNLLGDSLSSSVIIPCATRGEFEINAVQRDALRAELGLEGRLVFCYAGSANAYQLPRQMGELFNAVRPHIPNVFFMIFTHNAPAFEQVMHSLAIPENMYRIEFVSHEQIFEHIQACDIGLLFRDDSLVNRAASPTKFAEYLLCGLPVLTTEYVGDYSALVKEFSLGHMVDLDNIGAANDSLLAFLEDVQANRADYAVRCTAFARHNLSWQIFAPQLTHILRSVS